jgi:hypothetical protein
MKYKLLCLLVGLMAMGLPVRLWALGNPDTIVIEQVRKYPNVRIAGDALIVAHYQIAYGSPPAESISAGWVGRMIDVGGTGQLASVNPISKPLIPDNGYSHGIYSFYFEIAPAEGGIHTVTLEGNPILSPTPAGVTSSSIEARTSSQLAPDMRALALHLEQIWGEDVVTFTGGPGRLTSDGENYFVAAIPGLRDYAPSLFSLGFITPDPSAHIDAPDSAFETARTAVWAGTPLRAFTTTWSGHFGLSRAVFETVITLLVGGALGFVIFKFTESQEVAIFTLVLWINVAAFMGLAPLALPYMMAFSAVFILGYLIFFRPASV